MSTWPPKLLHCGGRVNERTPGLHLQDTNSSEDNLKFYAAYIYWQNNATFKKIISVRKKNAFQPQL